MNKSIKEDEELKLILSGLEYQVKQKTWTAHYPWSKDPHQLPNNFGVVLMKLKGTEKRLRKLDKKSSEDYNEQICDMLRRGVARKLASEESKQYKGPVHYLSHHEAIKGSASTPTRTVCNASASYNGHVLNDYSAKGPNVINSLFWSFTLIEKKNSVAFVGDAAKMFNTSGYLNLTVKYTSFYGETLMIVLLTTMSSRLFPMGIFAVQLLLYLL